ncbi:SGNH/GDSL hydrolase family protein [Methylibium sp.]|uniref:SGNH/GDSL hydrolase family protein n=1 Tax=Methylibium sp. TaxID=2067992 RepID=UPI003D0BE2CE
MERAVRRALTLCVLGLWTLAVQAQPAGQPAPARAASGAAQVDDRWQESLDAFAAADRARAPQPGGVLFIGSSSIRLWPGLETQFGTEPVLNRGFGGSRMSDCARYVEQLVLPYRPRLVIVYAGDNDLAEGRTPREVLASFTAFVKGVRRALPDTRITYLSIKPSPLRAALMPRMVATNTLIAGYSRRTAKLDFIDVYSKMLDDQGRPRADLFRPDALHLNAQGYALWRSVIADHLHAPAPPR